MAKKGGCLMGCALGCLGIIIVIVAAGGVGYYKVVKPMQASMERMSEIKEDNDRLRGELEALNTTYAYTVPEDPATLVITGEDVDRYVAVRTAVAEELGALVEEKRAMRERFDFGDDPPGFLEQFRAGLGIFGDFADQTQARNAFLQAARPALEEQRMSPRELETLLGLIEWRLLGRDDAAFFGLPPAQRDELIQKRNRLHWVEMMLKMAETPAAQTSEGDLAELRQEAETLREEIGALEEQARQNRQLHPSTRSILEDRQAALEAFDPAGVSELATLTEEGVEMTLPVGGPMMPGTPGS